MKKYADELVSAFDRHISYIDRFGVTAEVRGIPDEPRPGALDPRELPYAEAYLKQLGSSAADIFAIRRATGYVNYNINTVELLTDLLTVPVEDRFVRVWMYWPRKPFNKKDRAGFIYLHSGSFFAGSPFMCENTCRFLAEAADCVVFNVDYSLAPEAPFPAAYNDCRAVLDYVFVHAAELGVDPEKLCMGGDSAGGLLAAAVRECDEHDRIKLGAYYYPCETFQYLDLPFEWHIEDFEIFDEQHYLIEPKLCLGRSDGEGNDRLMLMIKNLYLQHNEDPLMPSVSPMLGKHGFSGKTLIFTSEFDGLRYHGEYYAGLLKKAGADVRLIRYRGVFHAFLEKTGILPQAEDAILTTARELASL